MPVTVFTAAILGLVLLALSYRVSQIRLAGHVSIGDGGNDRLLARIRAQGNFIEYAPMIVLQMALIEFATGYSILLGVCSVLVIVARVSHAIGMDRPSPNPFRVGGTAGTWIVLLVLSVWLLIIAAHPGV